MCFGAKIRKIGIPLQTPVFLYKLWGLRGVYFSWTCFHAAPLPNKPLKESNCKATNKRTRTSYIDKNKGH